MDPTNRHLTHLAELLVRYPTVVLSGDRMAQEVGVTRSTVWRSMEQLRALGVRLRGHAASGYQLESMPDLLLASLVLPALRSGALGRRLHHAFKIDSTQRWALEAAAAGEPHGSLYVAEEQTAGRGRQGHTWQSPASTGIYCSLLLRPPGPPSGLLPLTLGAGVAVAEAIRATTGLRPDVRWPNDIMLAGKKCGGLLLEMAGDPLRIQHAVLGIGINVNQLEFGELAPIATSLRLEGGKPVSRAQLLSEVLRQLDAGYEMFVHGGSADLLADFCRLSSYAEGREVQVGSGAEAYTGVTVGLDELGFLRVRRQDGSVAVVLNGEVRPVS